MGDHAYNIGDGGDARGDGYMNAYQKVLTRVPWIPVVGNHESGDGDNFERYFNQTWGHVLGQMPGSAAQYQAQATNGRLAATGPVSAARRVPPPAAQHGIRSSATSQLGALLSTGLSHGVGREGATPSGTSRWFSSDFGLVHWISLDLNVYYFPSECEKTVFLSHLYNTMRSFYQDRLGTNIGKLKNDYHLIFSGTRDITMHR